MQILKVMFLFALNILDNEEFDRFFLVLLLIEWCNHIEMSKIVSYFQ